MVLMMGNHGYLGSSNKPSLKDIIGAELCECIHCLMDLL